MNLKASFLNIKVKFDNIVKTKESLSLWPNTRVSHLSAPTRAPSDRAAVLKCPAPPLFHRQLPAAYPCPHIGRLKPPKCSPPGEHQEMSSCAQAKGGPTLPCLTLIIPFPDAGWDIAAQIGIALLNFRSADLIPKPLTPVPIVPAQGNTTGLSCPFFRLLSRDLGFTIPHFSKHPKVESCKTIQQLQKIQERYTFTACKTLLGFKIFLWMK